MQKEWNQIFILILMWTRKEWNLAKRMNMPWSENCSYHQSEAEGLYFLINLKTSPTRCKEPVTKTWKISQSHFYWIAFHLPNRECIKWRVCKIFGCRVEPKMNEAWKQQEDKLNCICSYLPLYIIIHCWWLGLTWFIQYTVDINPSTRANIIFLSEWD